VGGRRPDLHRHGRGRLTTARGWSRDEIRALVGAGIPQPTSSRRRPGAVVSAGLPGWRRARPRLSFYRTDPRTDLAAVVGPVRMMLREASFCEPLARRTCHGRHAQSVPELQGQRAPGDEFYKSGLRRELTISTFAIWAHRWRTTRRTSSCTRSSRAAASCYGPDTPNHMGSRGQERLDLASVATTRAPWRYWDGCRPAARWRAAGEGAVGRHLRQWWSTSSVSLAGQHLPTPRRDQPSPLRAMTSRYQWRSLPHAFGRREVDTDEAEPLRQPHAHSSCPSATSSSSPHVDALADRIVHRAEVAGQIVDASRSWTTPSARRRRRTRRVLGDHQWDVGQSRWMRTSSSVRLAGSIRHPIAVCGPIGNREGEIRAGNGVAGRRHRVVDPMAVAARAIGVAAVTSVGVL